MVVFVRVQLRLKGPVGGLQGPGVDVKGAREAQEGERVGRGRSRRRPRPRACFLLRFRRGLVARAALAAAAKDQVQRLHGPAGPADERGPGGAGVLAAGAPAAAPR